MASTSAPRWWERARERGLYDDLAVGDLLPCLRDRPDRYDLITAADVLIYQGDLHPIGRAALTALRPEGILAFTVERGDVDPFTLQDNGRFAHSDQHLRHCASELGFSILLLEPTSTRREQGQAVPGSLVIWRKP